MKAAYFTNPTYPSPLRNSNSNRCAMAKYCSIWILDLYRQGKIKLDELISRYRPLDEINEAFDDLKQGKVARTVLVFE